MAVLPRPPPERRTDGRACVAGRRRANLRSWRTRRRHRSTAGVRRGGACGWRGRGPRTLPAAVVPVLVGTACAVGRTDVIAWRAVAAVSSPSRCRSGRTTPMTTATVCGAPTAASAGWGRSAWWARACGRRARSSGPRCWRSSSPAWPAWRWRSRSAPSCWWSARPPSPPAGSTRAARTRTATSGWASCSCSCSSGWSPPRDPPTCRRSRCRGWRSAPACRLVSWPRLSSS